MTARLRLVLVLSVAGACLLAALRPAGAADLIFNTQEFAPFTYSEGGVVKGPATEIVRKVCAEMRIECPIRSLSWRWAQQEVEGYTVGVVGPSNTSTALEKIKAEVKDLTIDMTPQDEAAFKKLSTGRVQAVFSNRDVAYGLVRIPGITNVRYTGRQQSLKYYYVGFSQKFADKALADQFSAAFRTLHRQGVIQEILAGSGMDPAPLE